MRRILVLAVLFGVAALACGDGVASPQPGSIPAITSTPVDTPLPSAFPLEDPLEDLSAVLAELESSVADELRVEGIERNCEAIHRFILDLGAPVPEVNNTCVETDLDVDGDLEFAVLIATSIGRSPLYGGVVVFDSGVDFEPVYRLPSITPEIPTDPLERSFEMNPSLWGAGDFNGDGLGELVLTGRDCGAHTCRVSINLGGFRGGEYGPLIRPYEDPPRVSISVYQAEDQVRFVDVDNDGAADLLVRQGVINSVGAGPQREATHTFLWDGELYTFTGFTWDLSDLRYFKVRDADNAFTAGDYVTAIRLYEQAISGQGLEDVLGSGSREELMAYSQFRVGLANLRLGRVDTAALAIAAATASYPVSLHGHAAGEFRDASGLNRVNAGDLSAGCEAMIASFESDLDRFREVWNYGYGNPEVTPESICPF